MNHTAFAGKKQSVLVNFINGIDIDKLMQSVNLELF